MGAAPCEQRIQLRDDAGRVGRVRYGGSLRPNYLRPTDRIARRLDLPGRDDAVRDRGDAVLRQVEDNLDLGIRGA